MILLNCVGLIDDEYSIFIDHLIEYLDDIVDVLKCVVGELNDNEGAKCNGKDDCPNEDTNLSKGSEIIGDSRGL